MHRINGNLELKQVCGNLTQKVLKCHYTQKSEDLMNWWIDLWQATYAVYGNMFLHKYAGFMAENNKIVIPQSCGDITTALCTQFVFFHLQAEEESTVNMLS